MGKRRRVRVAGKKWCTPPTVTYPRHRKVVRRTNDRMGCGCARHLERRGRAGESNQ
jgi:hypothetical protein